MIYHYKLIKYGIFYFEEGPKVLSNVLVVNDTIKICGSNWKFYNL